MKDDGVWDEDAILTDLLFTTNMSIADIAKELDWASSKVSRRIKQLGLSWVKRNNRKLSRGHAALLGIMQKLLPGEDIITEHPLGERLRLDIFCPRWNLAAEYHGRQHFFYSDMFYKDKYAFEDAKKRDERKEEICRQQGIALVVFRYNDELTDGAVLDRMLQAIRNITPPPEEKKKTLKGDPYYEAAKLRRRQKAKEDYQRLKQRRKNGS